MNESEIGEAIKHIDEQVEIINRRIGGKWRWLGEGLLKGFGSVLGAAAAILIIGWVLNVVGVIPAFTEQAGEWREVIQSLQKAPVQIQK